MSNAVADDSWLDIAPSQKLTNEKSRAPTMQRNALGKDRVWACDGEYIYLRRKKAHDGTLTRHQKFLDAGDIAHVETQDDVEIYKIGPNSPFKRQPVDVTLAGYHVIRRYAILAACANDFGLFVDCLGEMSSRLKGQYHAAFAQQMYDDELVHIFKMIETRQGPSVNAINRGVQSVRSRRGAGRASVLYLPPDTPKIIT
jgi:hypothetical protein